MAGILIREGEVDLKTQTEDHMKMGTEVGVMDLPTEECQGLQMVTGSWRVAGERVFYISVSSENQLCQHLDFGLLVS